MKNSFIILILIAILFSFCGEVEKVPTTPKLEFLESRVVDTLDALDNLGKRIELEVYLVDGDGNIGLYSYDTVPPSDTSKFYITEYRKEDGVFEPYEYDEPLSFRLPYLQPTGQDKTLKCTIRVDLFYPDTLVSQIDTLRYDLYVVDRSRNKSNVVSSQEIVILN